jgi:arylsulfatase A-like enzyme
MMQRTKTWPGIAALGIILFVFPASVPAQTQNAAARNVIIITLNATRADHCTPYGYSRNTTPRIRELSLEGTVFENAFAQSSWTLPSLASLLTSTYVHVHGVYSRDTRLPEEELTLAEILKKYKYSTAAFVGGLDTVAQYGLAQGFDTYWDETGDAAMGSLRGIIPRAIQWLRQHSEEKFFLFIQGYDVHPPFIVPEKYREMYDPGYKGIFAGKGLDYSLLKEIRGMTLSSGGRDIALQEKDISHIIARYDAALTYADFWVGKLLKELKDLRVFDNTLIIICSEHGEELGEHGSFDRFGRQNLYDEVMHVPLIIRFPGTPVKGNRVSCQVQLIDIMPTVLDFLKIPVNNDAQGKSLVSLATGTGAQSCSEYVYAEAAPDKWAMRNARWKLICDKGSYELYDLSNDSGERSSCAAGNSGIVYDLAQRFAEWNRMTRQGRNTGVPSIELTDEMKKNLREAGYW